MVWRAVSTCVSALSTDEITGQPRSIALLGQSIGGFVGLERLLLIDPLARQRVEARDLIGRLLHGVQHRVVVAGDRRIELRLAAPYCARRRPPSNSGSEISGPAP